MLHMHFPKNYDRKEAPLLDTAAALREDGSLVISLINRHRSDAAEVALKLPPGYRVKRSWTMGHADAKAVNDFSDPERVMPIEKEVTEPVSSWTCAARSVVLLSCEKVK
jgi:alpha-N-arabinofuranosidase